MAIKQPEILSRQDYSEAVVRLRLNASEIAKDTGIPRTYLSEFRNGDRQLRPEHLAKLRDYFEGKGIEFAEKEEPTEATQGQQPSAATSPHHLLETAQVMRHCFPIAEGISPAIAGKTQDMIDENDARLVMLFKMETARAVGVFSKGDYTTETQEALQEAIALCASNYLSYRMLRGWRAFGVKASNDEPETIRDVLFDTFKAQLIEAGLIASDNAPAEAMETEEVEA